MAWRDSVFFMGALLNNRFVYGFVRPIGQACIVAVASFPFVFFLFPASLCLGLYFFSWLPLLKVWEHVERLEWLPVVIAIMAMYTMFAFKLKRISGMLDYYRVTESDFLYRQIFWTTYWLMSVLNCSVIAWMLKNRLYPCP